MSKQPTNKQLIDSLTAELEPSSPLLSGAAFVALLTTLTLVSSAGVAWLWGIRSDFTAMMATPTYVAELLAYLVVMVLASQSLWHLRRVCLQQLPQQRRQLLILSAISIAYLIYMVAAGDWAHLFEEHIHHHHVGPDCVLGVLMASVLPLAGGLWLAGKGAKLQPLLTGAILALAAGSAGLIAARIFCPAEALLHILIWHVLPVVALAITLPILLKLAWRR